MIVYGHRGARGEAPENTLPGFAYGYRVGLRAFELDVRLSADEELVVIHDATVDRTTNATGAVASLRRAEMAEMDARAAFPDWPEPCGIPTLNEVLAALPPDVVRLEIEIKRDMPERLEALAAQLIPLLRGSDWEERVTLSSFDAGALEIVARLAPDLPRAFIAAYDSEEHLKTALDLGCVQADIPLATGSVVMVERAQAAGLRVTGWPGNTPEQLETLLAWGVEGVTTDYPGVALPFLRDRHVPTSE